jgi:RND family efflux transporter MFP subunit
MRSCLLSLLFVVFSVTPIVLLRLLDADIDDGPVVAIAPPAATVKTVSSSVASSGFVGVVRPRESVELAPKIEGKLEEVLFHPGARVQQGMPLARLDTRGLQQDLVMAKAELAEVKAKDKEAQSRLRRRRALSRYDGVAREELDEAKARASAMHAKVIAQRARIAQLKHNLEEAELRAPFDGVVATAYASQGSLVGPTKPVLRLLSAGALEVRFAVPETRAEDVHARDRVVVELRTGDARTRAEVIAVSPEVDPSSHMIFASARLEASEATATPWPPGSIVRVTLPVAKARLPGDLQHGAPSAQKRPGSSR